MEENKTPGQRLYQEPATTGSSESLDDSSLVSSYASLPQANYQVDNMLEVHDQGAAKPQAQVTASNVRHAVGSFSKRKALIVSVAITVAVTLFTGASALILGRNAPKSNEQQSLATPVQDINLQNDESANLPPELQGADESLLVAGDIITRGNLKFSNNSFVTVLASAELTGNQTFTLPNSSGILCLDSNNCNYTNLDQFNLLNNRVNQLGQQLGQIDITAGVVTALNNQQGAITIQGTSNQISVTTANGTVTLATPQDLAAVSSPTFSNLLLTGNFTVNGIIDTGLNCTTFLNGGALTTNASGQLICADDEVSGGGTSVITAGGTAGTIPVFIAADEIADSIISQALGTITVTGALDVTGAMSANSLTLTTALSVPNGGTGATSFTANSLLVGNGAGAVTSTNAAANGQVLLGNGTTPTFTTISGDIAFGGTGVTTIQADSVALGVDTTGNYLADITVGNGLSVSGGAAEGAIPTVSLNLQANKGLEVDVNGLSLIDCGLNQVLKYNGSNQWACAADTDTTGSFNVAGDSGTPENVANGDTVTIQGGNNITTTVGATDTVTIATVNNPTFTTSVTTPLLQSSGALSITPGGALTVGAAGQTALLQGSTTTITSNGAGNDIVLASADQIRLSGFNCTTFTNGGVLTTDASGNLSCANDDSAPANTVTGAGTANRLALFTGAQTVADSWLLQNGSTLELDNTRNLSLTGGNFSVTGTGLFTGLITANGGVTVEAGDTFTFNGDAFTDLTGTGLQLSSGSLQTTLGTSVDLTAEVTGILPVANGGTGVNGSTAANGTLLIGNGTGYTLATLTAGSGITVNNGSGSIEIVNFFGTSIESGEITDLTITGADIANDTIALGGKTTGNYVATIAGSAQIDVTGSGSETAAITLGLIADSIGDTQLAFDTGQHLTTTSSPSFNGLTLSGNLTVQGGNTTVGTAAQAGTLTLSDGSANTGALQTASLGQNTTFTLPDPGAASATICLSTGNCAGAGGGVTTAGGTTNRIALFNGAQTIADSWLLQNGSTLQLDNTRNLELIGGNLTLTNGNLSVTGNQTTSGTVTFSALANGFLEVNGSGLVAVGTIDLGADTAGNYVATITNGNGITGSSSSEGGTPTIALGPLTADWVQSGAFDIVLGNASAELRILESAGATFYGTFDVGDLSQDETYSFLQGGTVVTSGNVTSFATTAVTAGNGLTGGGTTGALTLDIGAGNGITVNANDIAVIYGSAANTAVQGNTSITVSAGTNLTGGGSITLGAGGTVTLDVANSPTFSGTVTVQGSSVSIGTASTTTGSLDLYNASSAFAGSIQVANLGQATLYTLPDPGAAGASICLSTGNCAGSGGGVTTAGGTNNRLAKFTGAQVIADSTISDDGTNVTTSVDLIVQGGSATIGTALQDGALTIYGNGFTAAVSASLTGNRAYTLPDGTGEFCIKELGNCSGAGGGNAPNSASYLTLALDAGLTSERTLSFNGTNFSVVDNGANGAYTVNTAQNIDTASAPSFAGLTLTGNLNLNANTIQGTTTVIDFTNFDVSSTGVVTAGTYNGQTISNAASFTGTLTVAGLTTLNGGLTIETGDTLTFNGDAFTDLTGNGLQVSTNVLTLMVQANKGLEVDGNGLSLIDCLSGEVLKYNGSNQWACAMDAGSGGLGDDVSVNGVAATGANFINTTANGTTASVTWTLNNVTDPDEVSLTVGVASATEAGVITTGAQTFAGVKTFNNGITLAANQTINLTGGATGSRPGSPTEGMLYFDTTTKRLLIYANGKWQADRAESVIVAASNSTQAQKDSADYVADGTADQAEINAALTEAAGGKVYLLPGTYVANATILVPNNTTLAGAGQGTLIELADIDATDNLIENSDKTTGTGIVIRDLRIDGRKDLNTVGSQTGVYLEGMGNVGSNRVGATISNVWSEDFSLYSFHSYNSAKNTFTSNTAINNSTIGYYFETSTDNTLIGNTSKSNNDGFYFDVSSLNNTLTSNTAVGNSAYGFHFTSTSTGNTLAGNRSSTNQYGISLSSPGNTVTGNTSFSNTYGVYISASNNSITGNTITGNTTVGVFLSSGSNNTVAGNTIHDNGGANNNNGIYINGADATTVSGNSISDTSAITTNYAINIANAAADNNYLADNTLNSGTINDASGGDTIYGGQLNGSGNYVIEANSGTIELQSNSNVTGTLTVSGLITANGGLTVEVGDTFTMNGDAFTDLTGNGLAVVSNALTISVQANKGLEVDGNGLSLIDCVSDDYILKYDTDTNTWGCAADAGGAGVGDDVTVNGSNADGANFIDTTANGSVAGVVFNLNNVPAPDNISITISNASATEAGAVTTGAQTFAGAKTFNGQIIAGAGIDIGSQTLQGTTAVINFTNFDVDASGNTNVGGTLGVTGAATLSSTLAVQGASITVGTAALQGTLAIHDGSGQTGSISVANLAANRTYTLPEYTTGTGTICLDSGNCAGSGSGVTTAGGTTDRIAKFTGSQAIGDSSISDNGTVVSVLGSVDLTVQGGDITLGTTSGAGSIILHDGNGQTTTITAGNSAGNLSFTFPTTVGSNGQCVKNSATPGVLTFANCNNGSGSGGAITLQDAYDAGNTIATTDNRNLAFTFSDTATDSSFLVNLQCATCSANGGRFAVQNGGTDVFVVSPNSGGTLVKVAATAAFQVQNTSNNEVLTVNTTGNEVRLGKASTLGGKLVFNNASNANTVTIEPGTIANAYTLTLPNLAAGSYDLCTSSGNCAGAGGGITGSGTSGQVAYFNGTGTITSDADFAFDGTNVALGGNLSVGGTTQTFTGASGTIMTPITALASTPSTNITLTSGGTAGATSNSGSLTLSTGGVGTSGNTGNVNIQSGNTFGGTAGSILMNVGSSTSGNGSILIGTAARAQTITIGNTTGSTTLTLQAGTGGIALGSNTLRRTAAGTTNFDLIDGATTTLAIQNSGAGVANVTIDGDLAVNGGDITSSAGTLNINTSGSGNTSIGTASGITILNGLGVQLNTTIFQRQGAGSLSFDLQDGANTTLALSNSGAGVANITVDGTGTFSGATVTVGAAALQGSYVIHDGDGETVSITIDDVAANSTIKIPDTVGATDTFCLLTLNNCAGSAFTLQQSYDADADGSDAIIAMSSADGSLIFRNPAVGGSASAYAVSIEQLATGAVGGLMVTNAGTGNSFRVNDDGTTSDTSPFIIDQSGRVGIGLATPTYTLDVYAGSTATSGSNSGSRLTLEVVPASAPAANTSFSAASSAALITGANVNADTTVTGYLGIVNSTSVGTLGAANGLYGQIFSGGNITAATGVVGRVFNTGTGTFTSSYGLQAQSPVFLSSGAITTAYGLHIGAQEVAGVGTGYGLYQAGASDDNYFAGSVGIGVASPARALEVSAGDNVARFTSSGGNAFIELKNSGSGSNISSISSTGDDLGFWTSGSKRLTIDSSGNASFGGTLAIQGATVTVGAAALQGSYVIHDGDGETVSITIDDVAANSVLKIPNTISASDTFCFVTLNNCVGSGVTAIGALDGQTKNANGATIASQTLYLQSADGSNPGLVTTGAQNFGGAKTFDSSVTVATNLTVDTNTLFVDATNNIIGMGTTSPEFKLHIVSDGGMGAGYVTNDTYGGGSVFQGRSANGTLALPTALTTGNIIAQFSGRGYGDTGFSSTRAAVVMNAAEDWTDTEQGSNINFFTTAIGTTTLSVKATITGDGNFGLGTETPTAPFTGRVLEVQNATGNASLYLNSGATDAAMLILGDGAASWHIENDTNDFFSLTQSGVSQRFAIDTSGNVGIGVYDAAYRLDVQTDSQAMRIKVTDADVASATDYFNDLDSQFGVGINGSAHLTNPNDAYLWQFSNNDIRFGTNNTERLLIAADGNVFVGNGAVNAAPNAGFVQGTGSSTAGTIGGVLTIAGGAGATATTGSAGGGLNLQGGNAGGSGNNNGGSVTIAGGTSTGTTGLRGSVDIQAAGGNVNIGGSGNGALNSWTTNGNALPATRADAGIVSYNGYVYVFGGSAGGVFDSPTTTVNYAKVNVDGSIGTWGTTTAMNAARQEFGFTVANGYVYAFGGNSGSYLSPTATNTVQFARIKADGTLDTWQTTTNLPGTRRLTSAASANGYVYVVGGTGGQTAVYYGKVNADGTISSWTTSANSLPAGREAAAVAAVNGYLYVVGGADSGATAQTSVYYSKLDPTNGANAAFSTETDTLPVARADAELVVMNGQLYVLGGQAGSAVNTVYYAAMNNNGSINAWSTNAAPITAGRYGHMSVAVNGYAYVMGGINGGSGQSTVYYASIQRVRMAGAIDLLGISGENLAEGGIASTLTAGNTLISGSLQVTDTASIAGAVTIGRELSVGGATYVRSASATDVAMTVQGASGQTADLMQLKDGTGAVVAKFLSDGTALFGSAANCGVSSTLICIDESRIELKNVGGNNSTQIIQNSNGPLEFSNGPNSGTTFAGVLVKGDKTTAFQIQNGSSQSIFTADTVNSQLLTSNISPLTAASVSTNKVTNIASTNDVGWFTSVKIGLDGFARIVYHDATDGDLEYVRCTNYDCTTSTTTTIDSTGDVGENAQLEIGTDGFARIAYKDVTNTAVKYAVCNDANCSAPSINTVDNSVTDTGSGLSLVLSSNNLARMTYYQYNSTGPVGALRFAECTADVCTSGTANFTNIDATTAGTYTGLALGADGFARIAYAENNNNDLAYVRCTNASCSTTSTPVIIDATADNTGYVYDVVLDRQGNAMIPYYDNTGLDLEFIRCNDVDCTTRSTNTLDSTGNVGSYNSIVLGADGFARIAYYDFTNKNLKYVTCQSVDCATNSISTLEGAGSPSDVGSDTSVALRPDGRTVITYYDVLNGDIRMMQPSYSEGLSIGGASNRFARLFVADAEVTSTLRIGDTSNGINFSASNGFRLSGTARNSNIATLKPEYEGATFRGDGGSNTGTLNSSFCSNETGFTINTGSCNTGEEHSYYEWTHNETTPQDYDIIVRYRIPDNFDSAEAFSNHVAIRGYSSKSAASATNNVTLALYNDRGAQCGTTTNITNGTANQWGSGVLLSSISGDGDCEDIDAGEYVTFVIHMTANSTGTTGEIIRMGEIEISYKSTY